MEPESIPPLATDLILLTVSRDPRPPIWWQIMCRAMRAYPYWVAKPDAGYIETVLDQVIGEVAERNDVTPESYLLRLDDDEWASPPLAEWLARRECRSAPQWKFPRMHRMYAPGPDPTPSIAIINPPLWPDHQTRLSVMPLARGRGVIHASSPHPGAVLSENPIVHDKFLKPYGERLAIAHGYDQVMPGAGTGPFAIFNLPEAVIERPETRPFPWLDCPWRPEGV